MDGQKPQEVQRTVQRAVQAEVERESDGIAREYFSQMGEKAAPADLGFRAEAFLKDGAPGVQEIERVLVTAYVPESYPDGMIVDFRSSFRKHFEEQGYTVVFGPEPQPVTASGPLFDLRVRRLPFPGAQAEDGASLSASSTGAEASQKSALVKFFNGKVDAGELKQVLAPYIEQAQAPLKLLDKTEMTMIAGAGAVIAMILLCMVALAPLRLLKRRQQAQMQHRQYPATARVRGALPPAGEPPLFNSGYREIRKPAVDPEVERIRARLAQMGIKEVLEILRNLEPRYRDEVLRGLNVHKTIRTRIEKALGTAD
ncbi:MAG: hypothetical protein RIQ81_2227 [Pseudomonadota bacterium]|jgi:hypothetical protein